MDTTDPQPRDSHVRNRTERRATRTRRRGFSLDMTPLVDVAFLLLTFFMFATTMAQPQVIEMRVPPALYDAIQHPAFLTIYLRKDGALFTKRADAAVPQRLEWRDVDELAANHYGVGGAALALRVDTAARYEMLIDLIDRIRRNERIANEREGDSHQERSEGLSIERMTPSEQKEVGAL